MSEQRDGSRKAPPARRPDASMSLLTSVMEHGLDDGYAEAAARRSRQPGGELPRSLRSRLWLACGLVLAALVVTVGAAEARLAAPVIAKERQELIDRIQAESTQADQLHDDVDRLRGEVAGRQRKVLPSVGDSADLSGLLAGALKVQGPGLKLVLDDAEDSLNEGGSPRDSGTFSDTGRLRDRDIQRIVNGLWQAGAEAITVNGQRLTALSAIRHAGEAILVDNKPLTTPYTLLAVGDAEAMSETFKKTADGRYLTALQENYGIRSTISQQDKLTLPAAPSLSVRQAEPVQQSEEKGTS